MNHQKEALSELSAAELAVVRRLDRARLIAVAAGLPADPGVVVRVAQLINPGAKPTKADDSAAKEA